MSFKNIRRRVKKRIKAFLALKKLKNAVKSKAFNPHKCQMALFTPVPPMKTGTALYAFKVYRFLLDNLDFISDFSSAEEYETALAAFPDVYQSHLIPAKLVDTPYQTELLNLGNSYFHLPYLQRGIQTKGNNGRYILLCETQICGLLSSYCQEKGIDFRAFLKNYYPEKSEVIATVEDIWEPFCRYSIFGIRPLIDLTGIKHFIVYRKLGKEMFLSEPQASLFEILKLPEHISAVR